MSVITVIDEDLVCAHVNEYLADWFGGNVTLKNIKEKIKEKQLTN